MKLLNPKKSKAIRRKRNRLLGTYGRTRTGYSTILKTTVTRPKPWNSSKYHP